MSRVFRIATMQAIKEIVEENSIAGRFGLIITEENVDEISKKVVDLFEMTLELRAKTQEIFGQTNRQEHTQEKTHEDEQPDFPRTKNAGEIYHRHEDKREENKERFLSPHLDVKLPRKRFELSLSEKERFTRR